jgi:4-amino-4-deoxy-L-arabinose transferase-like glycosyltransferase
MVYASFRLFGESEFSARIFPAIFGVLTVLVVYFMGKKLYGEKVGLASSMMLAIAPYHVIFSGTAQTDVPMVFFLSLAFYLYLLGEERKSFLALSGIAAGFAILTKQPAFIFIPVIIIHSYLSKIGVKKILLPVTISILICLPWFSFHLVNNPDVFLSTQIEEMSGKTGEILPVSRFINTITFGVYMGLSPVLFFFVGLGVLLAFLERTKGDKYLLLWVITLSPFFFRTPPGHEYYALPILPPLSILAGIAFIKIWEKVKDLKGFQVMILILIVLSTSYTTASLKYKYYTPMQFLEVAEYINENTHNNSLILYVGYGPFIEYYTKRDTLDFREKSFDILGEYKEEYDEIYLIYTSDAEGNFTELTTRYEIVWFSADKYVWKLPFVYLFKL